MISSINANNDSLLNKVESMNETTKNSNVKKQELLKKESKKYEQKLNEKEILREKEERENDISTSKPLLKQTKLKQTISGKSNASQISVNANRDRGVLSKEEMIGFREIIRRGIHSFFDECLKKDSIPVWQYKFKKQWIDLPEYISRRFEITDIDDSVLH